MDRYSEEDMVAAEKVAVKWAVAQLKREIRMWQFYTFCTTAIVVVILIWR